MIGADERPLPFADDEDAATHLLRLAGPRPAVPADRAERVRRAVHDRWQARARTRAVRRRLVLGGSALAAAAAIVLAVRIIAPGRGVPAPAPGAVVATVERASGLVRETPAGTGRLEPGAAVHAGDRLATGPGGGAALRIGDGLSVRLDRESRIRLIDRGIIDLSAGAIYVDTGRHEGGGLEVRTPWGTARDIGTQFEVRLGAGTVRLRVRSGLVQLRRGDQTTSAPPGTELTAGAAGVASQRVPVFGPDWEWAARLAPPLIAEGRPLAEFLESASREQGWTLRFADDRLAREAATIRLHGSLETLAPADAIAVALATSGLAYRLEAGELHVYRQAESR